MLVWHLLLKQLLKLRPISSKIHILLFLQKIFYRIHSFKLFENVEYKTFYIQDSIVGYPGWLRLLRVKYVKDELTRRYKEKTRHPWVSNGDKIPSFNMFIILLFEGDFVDSYMHKTLAKTSKRDKVILKINAVRMKNCPWNKPRIMNELKCFEPFFIFYTNFHYICITTVKIVSPEPLH